MINAVRQVDTRKALVGLVIADALFIGVASIPLFTGRIHDIFGLSEGVAGMVAGLYLLGVALSAFSMFFLLGRVETQRLVRASSSLCALGFLICWWFGLEQNFYLFAIFWFIAGLGGGLTSASAVALTATTSQPHKTFPILSFFEVAFASLGLALATWASARSNTLPFLSIGLVVFAGVLVIWVCFPRYEPLPRARYTASSGAAPSGSGQPLDRRTLWLIGALILGFTLQFAGNMTHPFIELIGREIELSVVTVGKLFVVATIFAFFGPITARLVVDRWGRAVPMLLVMLVHIGATLLLVYAKSPLGFALAVLPSYFLVFFMIPVVNGLVAYFDNSGRINATVIGIATLGFASAALLGGLVMELFQSYIILAWLCCLMYVIAIPALCYPAWLVDRERRQLGGQGRDTSTYLNISRQRADSL